MLLDGAVSLCEFLVEASFSGSGCGALISCLCTKRVALSRSPSEDLLCYFGALLFIYFFGCCWCWEGLQSKKKATHSHANANRRQQSKDSQSGLFFRRRLCISEQREQRAARAPLSRGCLPVASSPCAKLPHFPAAVCWSWDCVMVWIFERLKNTHTGTASAHAHCLIKGNTLWLFHHLWHEIIFHRNNNTVQLFAFIVFKAFFKAFF